MVAGVVMGYHLAVQPGYNILEYWRAGNFCVIYYIPEFINISSCCKTEMFACLNFFCSKYIHCEYPSGLYKVVRISCLSHSNCDKRRDKGCPCNPGSCHCIYLIIVLCAYDIPAVRYPVQRSDISFLTAISKRG